MTAADCLRMRELAAEYETAGEQSNMISATMTPK
jgi:hypothetical protein